MAAKKAAKGAGRGAKRLLGGRQMEDAEGNTFRFGGLHDRWAAQQEIREEMHTNNFTGSYSEYCYQKYGSERKAENSVLNRWVDENNYSKFNKSKRKNQEFQKGGKPKHDK